MSTKEKTQEQISAFADGELAEEQADVVLAALRRADGRADWEVYHQIGDVLRSDDMGIKLSSGFAARMAARLEMEPTIIAPATMDSSAPNSDSKPAGGQVMGATTLKRPVKRWAMPGFAAVAAMAAVAFVTTPQLMVATQSEPASPNNVAIASSPVAPSAAVVPTSSEVAVVSADVPEGVILRDPSIDDYLLAHHRFSPSVYSTAQYARSATFENDSNK
jgi:sigma-E factor negative regulatory protein RseA